MNTIPRSLLLISALTLLTPARVAVAQEQRVWIDANVGVASSASESQTFTFNTIRFEETASFRATYPEPSRGAMFDFGGGYMFTPRLGVGISFTGTAHEDSAAVEVNIPHPYYFDAFGSAIGETERELKRSESAVHLQGVFVPLHTEKLRVRAFAGPTFFRYKADMVRDVLYTQFATPFSLSNLVEIREIDVELIEGTGWGLHVGGDVSYFFSRIFGVGGFARFSRGNVNIDEPMSERAEELKVGGIQAGVGVRFRF